MNASSKVNDFEFIATLESQLLLNVSTKINVFESIATLENPFLLNVSSKVNVFTSGKVGSGRPWERAENPFPEGVSEFDIFIIYFYLENGILGPPEGRGTFEGVRG